MTISAKEACDTFNKLDATKKAHMVSLFNMSKSKIDVTNPVLVEMQNKAKELFSDDIDYIADKDIFVVIEDKSQTPTKDK